MKKEQRQFSNRVFFVNTKQKKNKHGSQKYKHFLEDEKQSQLSIEEYTAKHGKIKPCHK